MGSQRDVVAARLQGDEVRARQLLAQLVDEICGELGADGLQGAAEKARTAPIEQRAKLAWVLEARSREEHDLDGAKTALELRKACLAEQPEDEALKTLVARSLATLATMYHARNMQKQADEAHLDSLNLFAEVPLRTEPQRQPEESAASESKAAPPSAHNAQEGSAPPASVSPTGEGGAGAGEEADDAEAGGQASEDGADELDEWRRFMRAKLNAVEDKLRRSLFCAEAGASSRELGLVQGDDATVAPPSVADGMTSRRGSESEARAVIELALLGTGTGHVAPLPLQNATGDDTIERKEALARDAANDHVPSVVHMDASEQDVVSFGRQSYEDAMAVFRASRPGQRRIGFVRLDSQQSDRQISRRHAQIKYARVHGLLQEGAEMAWVLRDLDSTNGVLVNGVRIQEYPLKDGDIVSFGGGNHVQFGHAVTTQKRRPAKALFVFQVRIAGAAAASAGKSASSPSSSTAGRPGAGPVARLCEGYDASADERHFFVLYMAVEAVLHPERFDADYSDAEELAKARAHSQRLFHKAVAGGIPFMQWANWLRLAIPTQL